MTNITKQITGWFSFFKKDKYDVEKQSQNSHTHFNCFTRKNLKQMFFHNLAT
jgi:hypothetical protein